MLQPWWARLVAVMRSGQMLGSPPYPERESAQVITPLLPEENDDPANRRPLNTEIASMGDDPLAVVWII